MNRVKELREEPYTQKVAEAAVGLWTDNKGPAMARVAHEQPPSAEVEMAT